MGVRLILICAVLLSACAPMIVCNEPYMRVGADCCLDQNSNAVCDRDETVAATSGNFSGLTKEEKVDILIAERSLEEKAEAALVDYKAKNGAECDWFVVDGVKSYDDLRTQAGLNASEWSNERLQGEGYFLIDGVMKSPACTVVLQE